MPEAATDSSIARFFDEGMVTFLKLLAEEPDGKQTKVVLKEMEARFGLSDTAHDWQANVRAWRQQFVAKGLLHQFPEGHYRLTGNGLLVASAEPRSPKEIWRQLGDLQVPESEVLTFARRGATAIGVRTPNGFLVREGSTCLAKNTSKNYGALKEELIRSGAIGPTEDPDILMFRGDYAFASPSAAASVVGGADLNGQAAWRSASGAPMGGVSVAAGQARAWKITPGEGAWQWDECREGGFIAIGWDELGDLTGTSEADFDVRLASINATHPEWNWKKAGTRQAWNFSRIQLDDRIVANRGTREVLGIGTVTGPYYYLPGVRNGHRLPVRWDDTALRAVEETGWLKTLIPLSPTKIETLLNGVIEDRIPLRALVFDAVESLTESSPEGITAIQIAAHLDIVAPRPDGSTWKDSGSVIPGDFAVWQDDQSPVNWKGGSVPYPKLLERTSRTGEARYRVRPQEAILATARRYVPIPDRCWWVNIGKTLPNLRLEGGIWAWHATAGGQVPAHAEALGAISPGDLLFLNADGKLVGLAWVTDSPTNQPRPDWMQEDLSDGGAFIPADIRPMHEALSLRSIPREWRIPEAGPFDQTGACKSVFICPLDAIFAGRIVDLCPERFPTAVPDREDLEAQVVHLDYEMPDFPQIAEAIVATGIVINEQSLRRYHVSLASRGFVILSGISGTGKTWLAKAYAEAVGAEAIVVPVAPNWNSNEDLLGYHNPMSGAYHDTPFSSFIRKAAAEHERSEAEGRMPRPFHLILDEMNLARVEHYFAAFLSGMEVRSREGRAPLQLGPESVCLPPNLAFIGTVNVDETTHGFADKVYDRAHLIELSISREALFEFLASCPFRGPLMELWDCLRDVAPFAFRVADDVQRYVKGSIELGATQDEALDEAVMQKLLPKVKGDHPQIGLALESLLAQAERWPLSRAKLLRMKQGFEAHGIASYF